MRKSSVWFLCNINLTIKNQCTPLDSKGCAFYQYRAGLLDGQLPVIFVVGLVAKQIEKLRVKDSGDEIKGVVRIAYDDKERGFSVA